MFEHRSIMLPAAILLTTLLLALSIAASPVEIRKSPIPLPIARRLNTANETINILQHDQARVAALKRRSGSPLDRRDASIPIINGGLAYVANVGVRSPATNCKF